MNILNEINTTYENSYRDSNRHTNICDNYLFTMDLNAK